MIPPVKKGDEESNEESPRGRPQWLKWYYANWAESTALMDSEQCGWYMRLLMYAASQGKPVGYLEDDEEQLKEIAGYQALPKDLVSIITKDFNAFVLQKDSKVDALTNMISELQKMREERWSKVRRKWKKSVDNEGLLYNSRLLKTIREANSSYDATRRARQVAAKARWEKERGKQQKTQKDKHKGNKPLNARALQNGCIVDANIDIDKELKTSIEKNSIESKSFSKTEDQEMEFDELEITEVLVENSVIENSNNSSTDKKKEVEKILTEKKSRKQPETLFDEKKFAITDHMLSHIKTKHPDLNESDIDFMDYKFRNVMFGRKHSSWSRTFYNFVSNQMVMYGYIPGTAAERYAQMEAKKLNNNGNHKNFQQIKHRETTDERHDRLEREADELYTSLVQGGSKQNHQENSKTLALATNHSDLIGEDD